MKAICAFSLPRFAITMAAATALLVLPEFIGHTTTSIPGIDGKAYAQGQGSGYRGGRTGSGGGGGKGPAYKGGKDGLEQPSDHGHEDHGDAETDHGSAGHGAGGREGSEHTDSGHGRSEPGTTDEGSRGPRHTGDANRSEPGSRGGKPVWAKEGIPEVELGRLNVVRSPEHVISKALNEAVASFNPAPADLYDKTAEDFATIVSTNYDSVARIDSPLENLGLYEDLMRNGVSELQQKGVAPASKLDLAAILLGSASDKAIPVSEDTVRAVNTILDLPALSDTDTATLAAKADQVRAAILAGHGY